MATLRNLMIRLGVGVDESGSRNALGKLTDMIENHGAIAGIAGGVALASGLVGALDLGASRGKLQAQLGVTASESERIGGVAGNLFSKAYGESMEDVQQAVTKVIQNMDGMRTASSQTLQDTTAKAMTLSKVLDEDVGRTTEAVSQIMRTGLAKSSDEAFDILTKGQQLGINRSNDLLDTFVEYPVQFKKLGLAADTTMGLLNQGLKAGARNSDLVADALKEFAIRAVDGSSLTAAGFDMIGLSGTKMQKALAKGGESAKSALDLTLKKLRAVPDPALRAQAAVALFGTQSEDLGDSLYALDVSKAVESLGKVEGATKAAGQAMGETAQSRMEQFKRSVQTNLVGALDKVVSLFNKMPKWVQDFGVQFATISTIVGTSAIAIVKLRQGIVALVGTQTVIAGLSKVTSTLGDAWDTVRLKSMYAMETVKSQGALNTLKSGIGGVGGVASKAKSALSGMAGFLTGPWGIAIAAGVSAVTWFATRHDEANDRVRELADTLDKTTGAITAETRALVINREENAGLLKDAQKIGINLSTLTDAFLGNHDALTQVNGVIDKYFKALEESGYAASTSVGGVDDLTQSYGNIRDALNGSNSELNSAVSQMKRKIEADGRATVSSEKVAGGLGDVEIAASKAAGKVDILNQKLNYLNNNNIDATTSAIDFAAGLQGMTDTVERNIKALGRRTHAFDINTEAGRENTSAVIAAIQKASQHADAIYKQTGSVEKGSKAFRKDTDAIKENLRHLGLSRSEINKLINKYADMSSAIANSNKKIKDKNITIGVQYSSKVKQTQGVLNDLLKKWGFATGGIIPGYTPGRDNTIIAVGGGEAILRPEFTKALGKDFINRGNSAARSGGITGVAKALGIAGDPGRVSDIPHFAGGGIVAKSKFKLDPGFFKAWTQANQLGSVFSKYLGTVFSAAFSEFEGGGSGNKAVKAARRQIGVPYSWGGGGLNGPSLGFGRGAGTVGFDCSSLVRYAWYQAVHKVMPRTTYTQWPFLRSFSGAKRPGDIGQPHPEHTFMYSGNGKLIEAPYTGARVREVPVRGASWKRVPSSWLKMDNGGVLPPHSMTPVYNGTNKPEYAIPQKYLEGGKKGDTIVYVNVNASPATDRRALGKEIVDALSPYLSANPSAKVIFK